MKHLTNSDLINIEAFKSLIKLVSNDILQAKHSAAAPMNKANQIFKLYRQKAQLINNAKNHYPHINWIDESFEERKQVPSRDLKLKELFSGLGLN